jgi:predicted NBD/HSP70 family sugar kinase
MTGHMRARSESGTVFFRQIDGSVEVQNKQGDIIVSRCTGPVTLRTVTGDVRIGTVGGQAVLETLNGDIEVQTAHDLIMAQAAEGNIEAGFAQIADGSRLKTALGNITAAFNPEESFLIHATARWGQVLSDLPLEELSGGAGHSRLVGRHNGGGPRVDLQAGGGQVKLTPGRPLFEL